MKLLFVSMLISMNVYSAKDEIPGVDSKRFVSEIKEIEIENQLQNSSEVRECLKKSKYDPSITNIKDKQDKLLAAEKCFKDQLPKDKETLEKFSSNLGLQQYGLVKSNNVQEITKFLSNKLYLAMTGVDRDKQKLGELMKAESFKNRKMVDQKDFVDLYKTQLTKNALFEISRFCFEDLRLSSLGHNLSAGSFTEYWQQYFEDAGKAKYRFTDEGKPEFTKTVDGTDKASIYKSFAGNLGSIDKYSTQLSDFFNTCVKQIGVLCTDYEKNFQNANTRPDHVADTSTTNTVGAKACLTKERMRGIKKAISDTELLAEDFEKNYAAGKFIRLDDGMQLNRYDRSNTDTSMDALTNYSSADFLGNGQSETDQKAEECIKNPEIPDCERFVGNRNSNDEILYDTSMKMRLKDQAEIARLVKMKKDNDDSLEKYLESNGYYSLLKDLKSKSPEDLEKELTQVFDSKREALLSSMNKSLERQKKDPPAGTSPSTTAKKVQPTEIETAAKASQAERQRLGQVVLFNNIITSHLQLQKKKADGEYEDLGMRNTKAMEVELKGQRSVAVDEQVFQNLKETDRGNTKETNFEDISLGSAIFDPILGEAPKKKP